jgi:hypothetical protein
MLSTVLILVSLFNPFSFNVNEDGYSTVFGFSDTAAGWSFGVSLSFQDLVLSKHVGLGKLALPLSDLERRRIDLPAGSGWKVERPRWALVDKGKTISPSMMSAAARLCEFKHGDRMRLFDPGASFVYVEDAEMDLSYIGVLLPKRGLLGEYEEFEDEPMLRLKLSFAILQAKEGCDLLMHRHKATFSRGSYERISTGTVVLMMSKSRFRAGTTSQEIPVVYAWVTLGRESGGPRWAFPSAVASAGNMGKVKYREAFSIPMCPLEKGSSTCYSLMWRHLLLEQ